MIFGLLKLDYLSPKGFIGFWVLLIGLIFTGIMFFFVFFQLNKEVYSYTDKRRILLEREEQKERVAKLYPKVDLN